MATPSPSDTDKEPDECIAVLPPAAFRPTNSLDRTPPQAIAQPNNAKAPAAPKRKPNPVTLDAGTDKDNSNSNSANAYKEQMAKPKNDESKNSGIAKALALVKSLQPSGRNVEIKKQIIAILEPLVSNTEPEAANKELREQAKQTTSIEADLSEIKATIRTLTGSGNSNQRSWAEPHNSTPTPSTPTIHERVDSIEKTLNEINKTVKALAAPKTWAQAAATNNTARAAATLEQERAKRERLERGSLERAKTTMMLTFRGAGKEGVCPDATSLQAAINKTNAKGVAIRSVQKLPGKMVRVNCDNEESAQKLRHLQWEELVPGITLAMQEYGIVLHGVPIHILDARSMSQDEMREIIQCYNDGINVHRVAPLTKKPRNPGAPTQSIVIYTTSPTEANTAIEGGIHLEWRSEETHEITTTTRPYDAKRYNPQHRLKQCFKCQAYGHVAETCTRKTACGRCAEQHDTRTCQNTEASRCVHCQGDHPAWHHNCPKRQHEHEKLKAFIEAMPTSFQC